MLLAQLQLHLHLPPRIHAEVDARRDDTLPADEMALAIDLSRRNLHHGSGGHVY